MKNRKYTFDHYYFCFEKHKDITRTFFSEHKNDIAESLISVEHTFMTILLVNPLIKGLLFIYIV